MSGLPAPPATTASGKMIVLATITAAPGKEARTLELLTAASERANSDAEPKTIYYRVTRNIDSAGAPGPVFVVFEEYLGIEGFKEHGAGAPLVALHTAVREEGLVSAIDIKYLEGI